jgi:cytochrome bd ubiquinol oxidase subunit II
MHYLEYSIAFIIAVSLNLYVLSGGADFGGGIWDLFAIGLTAKEQRKVISEALAPIWEANHVWLIIVVVLLFVAFPGVFAFITTYLHVPLTLMLIGIVLRGSAFIFRFYGSAQDQPNKFWSSIFAIASLITPLTLGLIIGAISAGRLASLNQPGHVYALSDFFEPWSNWYSITLGIFTLSIFAYVAATYLTLETDNDELKKAFRMRAIVSNVIVTVLSGVCLWLTNKNANYIFVQLIKHWWFLAFTVLLGIIAIWALIKFKYQLARILVVLQVSAILWGWFGAQFPYLILPNLTIVGSAASAITLWPLLFALVIGGILLVPSLSYLYFIFKFRK